VDIRPALYLQFRTIELNGDTSPALYHQRFIPSQKVAIFINWPCIHTIEVNGDLALQNTLVYFYRSLLQPSHLFDISENP